MMRINSKQRSVLTGFVAATLAFTASAALAGGRGGAGGARGRPGAPGVHAMAPGFSAGPWLTTHPFAPGGPIGRPTRYGEFGIYHHRHQNGCESDGCGGGGYWGGGGVFYGAGYYDPNYQVGPAAAGPYDYDPNYQVGLAAPGRGYYDSYATGRPAAYTAAPTSSPQYGVPVPQAIEVPAVVAAPAQRAANPHIIELQP